MSSPPTRAELVEQARGLTATVTAQAEEVDALESLVARQRDILTGVANALRGDPGPLASHSHHDLAERAAQIVATVGDPAAVRMEPMTPSALDAACAAEDRATADEPLLDGTDGAHPAWWRGHDRAAEMLSAQRDAARADAAALRSAAREYLALRDAVAAHQTMARLFTDYAEFVSAIDKLTVARDALRSVIGGAS